MKSAFLFLTCFSAASMAQIATEDGMPLDAMSQEIDAATHLSSDASQLFSRYQDSIVQIRVINEATGQKTSIGSGFLIGDGSLIATNYHVISDVFQKEKHRPEYLDSKDQSGKLELINVDIIHDLAILRAEQPLGTAFTLAGVPNQGEALYALGNPHDLGFVIIDGINNGLLRKSARAQILFSGALNSGMSGGPTLNNKGEVVGINVSYLNSGSNISFIIPAQYLQKLIDSADNAPQNINDTITEQLFVDNHSYYADALKRQWQQGTVGDYLVPLAMSDDVRCWDSSPEPDIEDLIGAQAVTCFNDRSTYINNDVTIGEFGYSYTQIYAREPILSSRFYRNYSQAYRMHFSPRPMRDYGNFDCEADFVSIAGSTFKTTFCRQPSKHFAKDGESIDDMRMIAAKIGDPQSGFLIEIVLHGVQTRLGKAIMAHMLEQITWQN